MKLSRFAKIALISALATTMTTEAFAAELAASTALNVRTGPGTGFVSVDTLHAGEVVDVGQCQSNGWCYVQHNGPDGWVSGKYLVPVNTNTYGSTTYSNNNSSSSSSSSSDAAAAAAFIAILGIGALAIGSAIASDNNKPRQPAPPPNPNWHRCPAGTVWSFHRHACVVR